MTTTEPGLRTNKPAVKSRPSKSRRGILIATVDNRLPSRLREASGDDLDEEYIHGYVPCIPRAWTRSDDPTDYPSSEIMCREVVENEICLQLQYVLRRQLAQRGIVAYVGSDNFLYWKKGDNTASVSPDIYVLPGIAQGTSPADFAGSDDDQCWKTWIHGVVPNFAIEVKARRNARKDELQSPDRHDALGTKELIVFDPFLTRRRRGRKRFVVHRRDPNGKLVIVHQTNDDRVYSQELDAFVVAQGEKQHARLRLALGPNGENILPFESELVDMQTRRADEAEQRADRETHLRQEATQRAAEETRLLEEATQRAAEEARLRQEATQRAAEEARLRQEATQRAAEEARLRQEATQRAAEEARLRQEATQRAAELEAELARLRAAAGKRSKSSKSK